MNKLRENIIVILNNHSDIEIKESVQILEKINNLSSKLFLLYYYDLVGMEEKLNDSITDIEESIEELNNLALKDADISYSIALLKGSGILFEEKIQEMLNLLNLSSKLGNPLADLELGYYYMEEGETHNELKIAIKYFDKSIKKGLFIGNLSIAEIYVELDEITNARKHYKFAIDKGIDGYLGLALLEDELEHKFKTEEFLSKSYKMKPTKENTFHLGNFYLNKRKSIERALPYFEESISLGNEDAAFALGVIYFLGEDVKADQEKSFNYFKFASDKGELGSIFYMGLFYLEGRFVEQNEEEALKWLKIAAEYGDDDALELLKDLE